MQEKAPYNITVNVKTAYLEAQSDPVADRYVFTYTINIRNEGELAAKLMTRHWTITDADGKEQQVFGEGVVGERPYLKPGEEFQYTSGTVLETPIGYMQGHYQWLGDDGTPFQANIPAFTLSQPHRLN